MTTRNTNSNSGLPAINPIYTMRSASLQQQQQQTNSSGRRGLPRSGAGSFHRISGGQSSNNPVFSQPAPARGGSFRSPRGANNNNGASSSSPTGNRVSLPPMMEAPASPPALQAPAALATTAAAAAAVPATSAPASSAPARVSKAAAGQAQPQQQQQQEQEQEKKQQEEQPPPKTKDASIRFVACGFHSCGNLGAARCVALSPDGTTIAAGNSEGVVRVLRTKKHNPNNVGDLDLKTVTEFRANGNGVTAIEFVPDAAGRFNRVAYSTRQQFLRFCSLEQGALEVNPNGRGRLPSRPEPKSVLADGTNLTQLVKDDETFRLIRELENSDQQWDRVLRWYGPDVENGCLVRGGDKRFCQVSTYGFLPSKGFTDTTGGGSVLAQDEVWDVDKHGDRLAVAMKHSLVMGAPALYSYNDQDASVLWIKAMTALCCRFCPGGDFVVVGGAASEPLVQLDAATGAEMRRFVHPAGVADYWFSSCGFVSLASGRVLLAAAAAGKDSGFCVWDFATTCKTTTTEPVAFEKASITYAVFGQRVEDGDGGDGSPMLLGYSAYGGMHLLSVVESV